MIRYVVWAGICLLGVGLGFIVALGLIQVANAVVGKVPDDSPKQFAIVAVAHAAWGVVALATAVLAWWRIMRR